VAVCISEAFVGLVIRSAIAQVAGADFADNALITQLSKPWTMARSHNHEPAPAGHFAEAITLSSIRYLPKAH
jgi:hypothetical protein